MTQVEPLSMFVFLTHIYTNNMKQHVLFCCFCLALFEIDTHLDHLTRKSQAESMPHEIRRRLRRGGRGPVRRPLQCLG